MSLNDFFKDVTWPVGCTYNLTGTDGGACDGGAVVEHRVAETPADEPVDDTPADECVNSICMG
jgi:hypothetical protein